jgi:hypothetical protein
MTVMVSTFKERQTSSMLTFEVEHPPPSIDRKFVIQTDGYNQIRVALSFLNNFNCAHKS